MSNEHAPESKPITCGICGGATVPIRPRVPKGYPRIVCPTCLADRMDQIREISDQQYGACFAAAQPPSEPLSPERKEDLEN